MARELPGSMATAIVQPVVRVACFAEFAFASGTLRMWTGQSNIDWDGQTWVGAGEFAGISPVDETTETGASGLTFSLNGIPSELLNTALSDAYRGKPCKLWLAVMDEDWAVVDAVRLFGGRMDVIRAEDSGDTALITLSAESRIVDLGRARHSRYSSAEQQRLFPGDKGCEYVAKLAEKFLPWGMPPPAAAAAGANYNSALRAASRV